MIYGAHAIVNNELVIKESIHEHERNIFLFSFT